MGRASAAGNVPSGRSIGLLLVLVDDPAVVHGQAAGHVVGDGLIVGDDHDGRAAVACSSCEQARARRAGAVSRLPVGSSARTSAGRRRARARWPRAAARRRTAGAGRWRARCPRPTRSQRLGAAARRRRGDAAVEQAVGDVVERRLRPASRWNCWKTKPTRRAAERARAASSSRPRRARRCGRSPLVGRSSAPSRLSSVDLPEPDGPTIATSSPRAIRRSTPSRRRDRRLGYSLTTSAARSALGRGDLGPPFRSRTRRHGHHHQVASLQVVGDLDDPSVYAPSSTATRCGRRAPADDLDGVAALGQRQQGVDRHRQDVVGGLGARHDRRSTGDPVEVEPRWRPRRASRRPSSGRRAERGRRRRRSSVATRFRWSATVAAGTSPLAGHRASATTSPTASDAPGGP